MSLLSTIWTPLGQLFWQWWELWEIILSWCVHVRQFWNRKGTRVKTGGARTEELTVARPYIIPLSWTNCQFIINPVIIWQTMTLSKFIALCSSSWHSWGIYQNLLISQTGKILATKFWTEENKLQWGLILYNWWRCLGGRHLWLEERTIDCRTSSKEYIDLIAYC